MMTTTDYTYNSLFLWGKTILANHNIENCNFDAMQLLLKASELTHEKYILNKNLPVSNENIIKYQNMIERRTKGEPLQYILGEWEFFGLTFSVGEGVLIPRPETEMLVEFSLDFIKNTDKPTVLDLCSGTGCIPISIAKNNPDANVFGVELSHKAYKYFTENITLNNVTNITSINKDIFSLKNTDFSCKFDVITSNPPYITTEEMTFLQKEVLFEPSMALDGGEDGLIFYRYITQIAKDYLKNGGMLAVEIGETQGNDVKELFLKNSFTDVAIQKDFNGNDRIVKGVLLK